MKRLFLIMTIACTSILLLASCSNETHKEVLTSEPNQSIELKNNINELFEENNLELEIKQSNGNYYKATPEFTTKLLTKLRWNKSYAPYVELEEMDYNLVLKFDGYKELYLNTGEGIFWITDRDEIFELRDWSKRFWDRHMLKEVEGVILYHSFEKDIIEQTLMDVDNDDEEDDIVLFHDGDIRLKVKDTEIVVMEDVDEEMVSSLIPTNNLVSHLYIEENEKDNSFVFLVGSTYSFTNKYGSTSWLTCFKYKDGILSKEWNSDDILNSKVIVKEYKNNTFSIYISGLDQEIDVKLTEEEVDQIARYLEFLKERNESFIGKEDYLFLAIMPQYKFYDYDNDGKEELVTRIYMRGGAAGITDQLISIYDFTGEGIQLRELLSGRDNEKLVDNLY